MPLEAIICATCKKAIDSKRCLRCSLCNGYYDLTCANVSEQRFYNVRLNWQCATWRCKEPKKGEKTVRDTGCDINVTQRRGATVKSPVHVPEVSAEDKLVHSNTADTHNLADEMREFREELRATRLQFQALNNNIAGLLERVQSNEHRLDQLAERLDKLEGGVGRENAGSNSELLSTIETLKTELNERDQELLFNDVEITCIPEQKGEGLQHIAINIANKLGVQLSQQDVVSAVRVGRLPEPSEGSSLSRPRPIVVRLVRRSVRDDLLREARVRRGATTEGLHLPGQPRKFYVNERLTRANRRLFHLAREAGERHKWRFVWTRDGRIYARQHGGQGVPRHRIRTEADLERVFGMAAVGSPKIDNNN